MAYPYYQVAYISSTPSEINAPLKSLIDDINNVGGKITHVNSSQSTNPYSKTIITMIIIYELDRERLKT